MGLQRHVRSRTPLHAIAILLDEIQCVNCMSVLTLASKGQCDADGIESMGPIFRANEPLERAIASPSGMLSSWTWGSDARAWYRD